MRITRNLDYRQSGAALLLIMLALLVATSTILLVALNSDDIETQRLVDTREVLATARAALIDYAVINPDVNLGRSISLPCPDIDGSGGYEYGEAHTQACGAAGETVIGQLPWRTLGLHALRDSSYACLWYIVSGSYKDADIETAAMINSDSNGQLQLYDLESGSLIAGLVPENRPIAVVIAAMQPVDTQTRPGIAVGIPCVVGANTGDYLETDIGSGISNAVLNGIPETIDAIGTFPGYTEGHNDSVVSITRADIEQRVSQRADFQSGMRSLGLAVAGCLANYAANNPGGPNDKRLPWPASVVMPDYRLDAAYDDADIGFVSGRLPDRVDDSNTTTGNSIARVLSDCDTVAVPEWTFKIQSAWRNWKDHFFYAVADSFSPAAATPSTCVNCLTVNGSGQYAGVLLFANSRLQGLGQVRNEPPIDTDTKADVSNYLEDVNASNVPGSGASTNYMSAVVSNLFNDSLFCIDDQLVVTVC